MASSSTGVGASAAVPVDPAAIDARSLASRLRLSRSGGRPLYVQLEDQLLELVASNDLPAGTTMPPERQLADVLGVSRATVQSAYNALREKRVLAGQGRRGSIIQPIEGARLAPAMDRLKGFTQEMRELGRIPSTRLLERGVQSDRSIASLFGLPSNARFLRLVRIRCADDVPMSVENAWYNIEAAPFIENADPHASMYAQLRQGGASLEWCDQTVETTLPSEFEREVFGFSEPTPCLLIKRRSHSSTGALVEYVEGLFRGDAYIYRLRLRA